MMIQNLEKLLPIYSNCDNDTAVNEAATRVAKAPENALPDASIVEGHLDTAMVRYETRKKPTVRPSST